MAARRRKRWVCPNCAVGKLAPARLARADTRRWCLPCSESTGHLVERQQVGAQQRKAVGREKAAKTRRQRREQAERARRRQEVVDSTAGPINVVHQAERWLSRLRALGHSGYVSLELRHRRDGGCSGNASLWRVVLSIGQNQTPASIYELILHELAHTVTHDHHGKEWRRCYLDATRQAFPGIELSRSLKGTTWDLDRRVGGAIDKHLAGGGQIRWHVSAS